MLCSSYPGNSNAYIISLLSYSGFAIISGASDQANLPKCINSLENLLHAKVGYGSCQVSITNFCFFIFFICLCQNNYSQNKTEPAILMLNQ